MTISSLFPLFERMAAGDCWWGRDPQNDAQLDDDRTTAAETAELGSFHITPRYVRREVSQRLNPR